MSGITAASGAERVGSGVGGTGRASEDRATRLRAFLDWYGALQADPPIADGDSGGGMARWASEDLFQKSLGFVDELPIEDGTRVLDIGIGFGLHSAEFARRGADVTGLTLHIPEEQQRHADEHGYSLVEGDMHFLDAIADESFDLVWSHHSLEHGFSPLLCLREWLRVLRPGGWLAVTVPPHKAEVVSGHFTTGWTTGQLMYMLGMAGYELRGGLFRREGYNCRALVRRPIEAVDPTGLSWMHMMRDRLPPALHEDLIDKPNRPGRYSYMGEIAELDDR